MSNFQGVTLTDLQEAEKTIKTENKGKERTKEEEEKEAKQKKGEEAVREVAFVDMRSVSQYVLSASQVRFIIQIGFFLLNNYNHIFIIQLLSENNCVLNFCNFLFLSLCVCVRACTQEVSWRSRIANLQKSDLLGLTHPPGAPRPPDRRGDRYCLLTFSPLSNPDMFL